MGQPFNARPWGVLDRIYRFVGGISPTRAISVEQPVTLVHDLSREAERGSGYGEWEGFWVFGGTNAHAGASTLVSVYWPTQAAAALLGISATEIGVWLKAVSQFCPTVDAANWSSSQVAMGYQARISPGAPYGPAGAPYRLLQWSQAAQVTAVGDAAGGSTVSIAAQQMALSPPWQEPSIYVPQDSAITFRSISTGVVNITCNLLCWVGPRGASPPGMA